MRCVDLVRYFAPQRALLPSRALTACRPASETAYASSLGRSRVGHPRAGRVAIHGRALALAGFDRKQKAFFVTLLPYVLIIVHVLHKVQHVHRWSR